MNYDEKIEEIERNVKEIREYVKILRDFYGKQCKVNELQSELNRRLLGKGKQGDELH